jgi:hypothetical protein
MPLRASWTTQQCQKQSDRTQQLKRLRELKWASKVSLTAKTGVRFPLGSANEINDIRAMSDHEFPMYGRKTASTRQ